MKAQVLHTAVVAGVAVRLHAHCVFPLAAAAATAATAAILHPSRKNACANHLQQRFQSSTSPPGAPSRNERAAKIRELLESLKSSDRPEDQGKETDIVNKTFASRQHHSGIASLQSAFGITGSSTSIIGSEMSPPLVTGDNRIPRMGPSAGRSVTVQGVDPTAAFTRLRSILSINRVRSDLFKQRFHERPGLKRKRLRRERHKKRFKETFKRMVGIVLDMKNRGM